MIEIENLRFSNDLFYQEETHLPFRKGLTLLRGVNYDAGKSESNSNGTGKTRLPQLLSSFIFNDSDRGNFKKMVLPTFKGSLEFTDSATKEKWMFAADIKEKAWEILLNGSVPTDKDGNPLSFHKFTDNQKFLAEKIRITQRDWGNFVHINRHSISTLLQGKADEKRKLLEAFFNIDDFYKEKLEEYKSLKAAQEKEIEKLEQDRARYGQVLDSLATLKERDSLTAQMEIIKKDLTAFQTESQRVSNAIALNNTDQTYWKDYYVFRSQGRVGTRPLATLKEELQAFQNSLAEVVAKGKVQETVLIKSKRLEGLKAEEAPKAPDTAEPYSWKIMELQSTLVQMRAKQRIIEKFSNTKKMMPTFETNATREEANDSLAKHHAKLAEISLHLSLAKDGKNCNRCGQSIDFILNQVDPEVRQEALRKEETDVKFAIKEYEALLRIFDLKDKIAKELQDLKEEAMQYPKFSMTLEAAEKEFETLSSLQKEWSLYTGRKTLYDGRMKDRDLLLAELTTLGYPEVLEEQLQEKKTSLQADIEKWQAEIDMVQKEATLIEKVATLKDLAVLTQEAEALKTELLYLTERIQTLNEQYGEFKAQLALANDLHKTKVELEEKLSKGENLYNEYRILQSLVKFFSPAGFKVYELRKRCDLLLEKANYWSPIFFSEQYEWSLPKDDIESLDFLVQPVSHRKTAPYSASLFSAGEENRGERVLLFSQLELAPKDRSMDLLVLDEIEGHLDAVGRTVFTEIVIPKLKETFSNRKIILISHEESLRNSPDIDHLWVAERRNRKTSLKVFENINGGGH